MNTNINQNIYSFYKSCGLDPNANFKIRKTVNTGQNRNVQPWKGTASSTSTSPDNKYTKKVLKSLNRK